MGPHSSWDSRAEGTQGALLRYEVGFWVRPEARMTKPTTLVLLPGLDGTEVFFQPLLHSLPPSVHPWVVNLPTIGSNEYADLLVAVRTAISEIAECYVLGWSFSGPLALMLAATESTKVRGVILAATFVRPPQPLLARVRFAAITPVVWTIRASRRVPGWLGRRPTDQVQRAMAETWTRVGSRVVAARVRALLAVDAREPLRRCPQPVLYLASSQDEVVPPRNVAEIVRVRPSVQVRTIAGRHLAMYTNPEAAARIILEFLAQGETA
jgi:pimeloyl-ACP methyl ester carboxylesterase